MKMPSVVIYYDHDSSTVETNNNTSEEMPIAWGFMSVDGSLATLHVEPEHRGQGLAVTLSKEVMRQAMMMVKGGTGRLPNENCPHDSNDHDAWTHADVATTNIASRRVMEKIGGQLAWTDTWTVLELCDDV